MPGKKIKKPKDANIIAAEEIFKLKPGFKFSDILMDVKMITTELYISARNLQYHRSKGHISYVKWFGKIYYLRTEIMEMMIAGFMYRRNPLTLPG